MVPDGTQRCQHWWWCYPAATFETASGKAEGSAHALPSRPLPPGTTRRSGPEPGPTSSELLQLVDHDAAAADRERGREIHVIGHSHLGVVNRDAVRDPHDLDAELVDAVTLDLAVVRREHELVAALA